MSAGASPLIDYPGGGSVVEWTKTLDGVLSTLDFDTVIPGQGPVSKKADLLTYRNNAEKMMGQLCSELAYAHVDDIVNTGMHEYLDNLQTRMNQVSTGIYETFFAKRVPELVKQLARERTQ